jgi:hypothetical protein
MVETKINKIELKTEVNMGAILSRGNSLQEFNSGRGLQ